MLGELGNAVLVDVGKEAAGQENAKLRVADARQRLGAGEAFALEVDLGLVPDLEPMIAQRLGDRDPRRRRRLGAHGIDQGPPFVLGQVLDRSGPTPDVLRIGIAHAV